MISNIFRINYPSPIIYSIHSDPTASVKQILLNHQQSQPQTAACQIDPSKAPTYVVGH